MSLPAFLRPGSPPRSPHVATSGFFGSYFSGASTTPVTATNPHGLPRASGAPMFRPTRRDLVLCLLTLSFSYLLFSQPSTESFALPTSVRLPQWSSFFPSAPPAAGAAGGEGAGRVSFSESVRPVRVDWGEGDLDELRDPSGVSWDGGEEEAEDDEAENAITILDGHAPGWTLFDRLYLYNGSFYVVTDDRGDWPQLVQMISTGLPANNDPGNAAARYPKGDEILFVSPYQAGQLWGNRVYRIPGTTWLWNDGQFMDHYYHFAAELLMGTWRAYMVYDKDVTPQGVTSLPPPERIWFMHQYAHQWRDGPRFNTFLVNALFPSTAMLYPEDFDDFRKTTADGIPRAYRFDRALLADRSASFYGHYTEKTSRTVASAYHVGTTSRWWWEPIRRTVLRYCGVPEDVINRNLEGYGSIDASTTDHPTLLGPGVDVIEPLAPAGDYKPVVTYISRQGSRRHLSQSSHADLVKHLEDRAQKLGWELNIVQAEKLSKEEQISLAGRTTIMLGVHGNGLTHLIWMPSTPRSAVFEMYIRGGFARDYEWTAESLGIKHYGVRHDEYVTEPDLPEVAYPEGFHGTEITVDGKYLVDLIESRLAGRI